jgi:preprotein translocase subunit SecE
MASITKNNGENSMAEEESDDRANDAPEEREEKASYRAPASSETVREHGGFFHIYKSGQGYWTRMGTVAGAGIIILLIANFFYTNLRAWSTTLHDHGGVLIGVITAMVVGLSALAFWIMNKPSNADFLIATDSEMKKVNWTSRRELIGSTKIVIIFVVLISVILFIIDILFGYLFYFLDVLKQKPF